MPNRRRSPAVLLLALLVALGAPVAVMTATGLATGPLDDEQVETADDAATAAERGEAHASQELTARDRGRRPSSSPTSSTVVTASPTTAAPTTTSSTVPPTTAPPATTPPPTEPPTTEPPAPPPSPGPPPSDIQQVVDLVNAARAQAGCGALRSDDRLAAAAQGHSDDMAAQGYFSHTSLDGRTFADRVRAAGYPNPGGENIAQGQRGAQEVHDAWMNSEGHRANILNCGFTTIGVGLHTSSWTWTQNFGY